MTVNVRYATVLDVDALVEMSQRFFEATPYGQLLPWKAETIHDLVMDLLMRETAVIFVAEHADAKVGMAAAWIYPHPFSGTQIAAELVWWVSPVYRGSAGLRLLQAMEQWATMKQVDAIQMVAPAGSEIGTVYAHRGYEPVETLYQRRVTL